jgi:hypothetical protein
VAVGRPREDHQALARLPPGLQRSLGRPLDRLAQYRVLIARHSLLYFVPFTLRHRLIIKWVHSGYYMEWKLFELSKRLLIYFTTIVCFERHHCFFAV